MAKHLILGPLRPETPKTAGAKKMQLPPPEGTKKPRKTTARTISVSALLAKKYSYIEGLPANITASFGALTDNFVCIIWGQSGNGKSSFILQLLAALVPAGNALYVSLEEGTEATMQQSVLRQLDKEATDGKIQFADHQMNYDQLFLKLKRRGSPRFIVIDSVQYWDVDYNKYKALKQAFPKKSFIFISHAKGKLPDGKTADKIRYDAGCKVHVTGYVAFVKSRYGGNTPYLIWPEGAKKHWGADLKNILAGKAPAKAAKPRKTSSKPKPVKPQTDAHD